MFAKKTEAIHMNGEDYKKAIIEMLDQIDDVLILRRIYLILVVITREGR